MGTGDKIDGMERPQGKKASYYRNRPSIVWCKVLAVKPDHRGLMT